MSFREGVSLLLCNRSIQLQLTVGWLGWLTSGLPLGMLDTNRRPHCYIQALVAHVKEVECTAAHNISHTEVFWASHLETEKFRLTANFTYQLL